MDIVTNLALGICLAAACGFRVFVPLLVLSVAAVMGHFTPTEDLAWIASWPALTLFATATMVEIVAYYIPWADNLLDTIATPAALIAGALAAFSVLGALPPSLQWIVAVVAGAGSAGAVQAATVVARGTSTATTGGAGNFVVATIENVLSIGTVLLAFVIPLLTVIAMVASAVILWRWVSRKRTQRSLA